MSAALRLDGASLRFTTADAVAASGAADALSRSLLRLDAARSTLATARAVLDALVALAALAAAAAAALDGGAGWGPLLRVALVSVIYAALIPLRTALLRVALRVLVRVALR